MERVVCMQFFGEATRSGRLPMEKMDLMNTVNQLLLQNNKLEGDKVALEEEVKTSGGLLLLNASRALSQLVMWPCVPVTRYSNAFFIPLHTLSSRRTRSRISYACQAYKFSLKKMS